ncbi:MAG: hypothetical protein U0324_14930 [Polyangiales bacterium]
MRLPRPEIVARAVFEFAFAAVTLAAAAPLAAARHVPLQDLPQHMAAIAVLRQLPFSATLGEYFTATLSRTQYLIVYALGVPLSAVAGVEGAGKLLAALTVVSLPYALRFALRRTGGDERAAALSWPLLWNPQMMLGFLNFLLGVPVALVALGLFADREARLLPRRQLALAGLALAAFYAHLIPYGLLGLGALLLLDLPALAKERSAAALLADAKHAARQLLFLAPSLLAAVVWVARTPATDASVRAGGVGRVAHAEWPATGSLARDLSGVLLDFPGEMDERALLAWGIAALAALAAGTSRDDETPAPMAPRAAAALVALPLAAAVAYLVRHRAFAFVWGVDAAPESSWGQIAGRAAVAAALGGFAALALTRTSLASTAPRTSRLAWLPAACALLYVTTPVSYGWIWPIHTRFAVTAALVLPLLAGARRGGALPWLLCAALGAASSGLAGDVGERFARWEQTELGDLDAALSHTRPGRRLVALVPAAASAHVPNVPLLHAAAYYQVRGGAVATFSFADFPQSPFRYREDGPRPPRLPPRWEWTGELQVADPELSYYDYVLARRGVTDEAARHPDRYALRYEGREWNLYERVGPGGTLPPGPQP